MLDEIVSIELIGDEETIDIEVDGDHLFYANDILIHNSGQANTDLDFADVSESHGLSATCDYMVGMVSTEELDKMNQVLFKQIKNRYGDISKYRRFVVGIDRDKMRLYDVEQSAQKDIADSGQEPREDPIGFDKTAFGNRMNQNKDFSKIKFDDDSDDMF